MKWNILHVTKVLKILKYSLLRLNICKNQAKLIRFSGQRTTFVAVNKKVNT